MKRLLLVLAVVTLLAALTDDASAQFRRSGGSKGSSSKGSSAKSGSSNGGSSRGGFSNGGFNSSRIGNSGKTGSSSSRNLGNSGSSNSRLGSGSSKNTGSNASGFQSRLGSSSNSNSNGSSRIDNNGNAGSNNSFRDRLGNGSSRIGNSRIGGSNANVGQPKVTPPTSTGNGRTGGSFLDRVRDRNTTATPPSNTKIDRGTVTPQETGKNPLLDRGSSIRDRVGNVLDRGKLGNPSNGGTKIDTKIDTNGGSKIGSRIGDVIDRTRIGGSNQGGSRIENVVNGGKVGDKFQQLTGKEKAAQILIGVGKVLQKHRSNDWGLAPNNGNASKQVHHDDWGLCVKKHGHGFGFCYRPHLHRVYHNPYCVTKYIAGCDYSVACVPVEEIVVTDAGQAAVDAAIEAFRVVRYDDAAAAIEIALREMPHNPDVRLLHSLILFAIGDYDNAAAACHTALTASEGWDWAALSSFYASTATYSIHLRLLENRVVERPTDPALRFLLGYHYMVLGYTEPAATQLGEVVRMQPNDDVTNQLLGLVQPRVAVNDPVANVPAEPIATAPVRTAPEQAAPVEIDFDQIIPATPTENVPAESLPSETNAPMTGGLGALRDLAVEETVPFDPQSPAAGLDGLVGTWTSNPTSGLLITFTITADGGFTWAVDRNGEQSSFGGTAELEGNTLTLTRANDGETLTGTATRTAAAAFQFQADTEGAPPITFQR